MANILLVEDDTTFSQILEGFLKKHGHEVDAVYNVKNGIRSLEKKEYDLLLLDYRLTDGNGLEVLNATKERGMHIPAIIMTSFNDVRTAVQAMRSGAFDYITKPVNADELLLVLNEALNRKTTTTAPATQQQNVLSGFIEGNSEISKKLYEYIKLVAPTDMSVIILGESGTGKEYVARSIHSLSKRADKPFIAVDCGALSKELAASELFGHIKGAFTGALQNKKGLFEAANGGTLFLDEVGNLSYEVQVKLLRALQERVIQPIGSTQQVRVDVRIITATNEDLPSANGNFREDLYHRLNEFKMDVPPLREREEDLEIFTQHFIKLANQELGRQIKRLSSGAMTVFRQYDWPGNLRELKNVIRRMVLLTESETAGMESLPDEMTFSVNQMPQNPKHRPEGAE